MMNGIHRLERHEAEEERQQVALSAVAIQEGTVPAAPHPSGRQTQEEMARRARRWGIVAF